MQVERKIIPSFFKILKANEAGDLDTRSDAVRQLESEIYHIALAADKEVSILLL